MHESDEVLGDLESCLNRWREHLQNQSVGSGREEIGGQRRIKACEMNLSADQLKAIVESAVAGAIASQKKIFDKQLQEISARIEKIIVNTPEVETYKDTEIIPGVRCTEPLDIAKSFPDFEGKSKTYMSWRKAAHVAFKVFENYEGSSTYYQALGIMRNKIKNSANTVLASFNTPLNFKAMINRHDFTYANKRPVYLIEQELSTLRQGDMTMTEFYDEVEKKLMYSPYKQDNKDMRYHFSDVT